MNNSWTLCQERELVDWVSGTDTDTDGFPGGRCKSGRPGTEVRQGFLLCVRCAADLVHVVALGLGDPRLVFAERDPSLAGLV